jgi:uncharacterized NAD(P)/FAD-binding protein YdhS
MPDVFHTPLDITGSALRQEGAPVIAIIGGGFTGALTAIKLLDNATEPLLIKIIEPRGELGRGLAYSTRDPAHVMNGPAKVFSLYPERPEHFTRFLARYGKDWGWRDPLAADFANAHAPRWIYGDYVRGELARAIDQAAPGVTLQHLVAEATALNEDAAGLVRADQVVLALGVFVGQPDISIDPGLEVAGRYLADPWNIEKLERLERLGRRGRVLLIGSGLTMLDTLLSLERHGHRGSYLAVSRRGLGLHPRRDVAPLRDFIGEQGRPATALALLRAARAELANTPLTRPDWQGLVMAIRPHVGTLWLRAAPAERRRFLRHLRRIWDTSLHRAAPQSAQVLERGRTEGWFTHRAGRLLALRPAAGRVAVDVTWRGEPGPTTIIVDAAVNCTGAQYDWPRIKGRPLVANLLASGLVRSGPLGFGVDADLNSWLIRRDGSRSDRLSAIGPPLRGLRWESSTVAEILAQAITLADQLLNRLHTSLPAVRG